MNSQGFYRVIGPLGGDCARVVFDGSLEGQAVVWDALFYTHPGYARAHPDKSLSGNLIEVGSPGPEGRGLVVVLDLPCIDQPTLLKTLHMIRQWKRLAPGRHVYGGAPR